MVSYGEAKARAMANRHDWNEREYIKKAVITFFDEEYEYDIEVVNDDMMSDEDFTDYVYSDAENIAKDEASDMGVKFEGIGNIYFENGTIDDDALFDEGYTEACEAEWEAQTGR